MLAVVQAGDVNPGRAAVIDEQVCTFAKVEVTHSTQRIHTGGRRWGNSSCRGSSSGSGGGSARSIGGKVGRRESGWDSVLTPGSGTRISIDYNHALYIFIYNNVAITPGFSSCRKSNNNAGGIALVRQGCLPT